MTDEQGLHTLVASLIHLNLTLKQAHWTVVGPTFMSDHLLYERLADELDEQIDNVAERMRQLNLTPPGRLEDVASRTALPEVPAGERTGEEWARILLDRCDRMQRHVAELLPAWQEDFATGDVFVDLLRWLDKSRWFLLAQVSGGKS